MFAAGLITFREMLEVVLVIGVILATLARTNRSSFTGRVWQGGAAGLTIALVLGYALHILFGAFTGPKEAIFEGTLVLTTAALLTWMILWVHMQEDVPKKMQKQIARLTRTRMSIGIFFLALFSVLREATEAVLYLTAMSFSGNTHIIFGAGLGILSALALGYPLFSSAKKFDLAKLFSFANILLILFAAGLMARGVHEFQEAGLFPIFAIDPIVDLSKILSEESTLGGFFNSLFGYFSTPTLLQIIAYIDYIFVVFLLEKIVHRPSKRDRRHDKDTKR